MAGVDADGVRVVSIRSERMLEFDGLVEDVRIDTEIKPPIGREKTATVSQVPAEQLPQAVPADDAAMEVFSIDDIEDRWPVTRMRLHAALVQITRREVRRPDSPEAGKDSVHLRLRGHGRVPVAHVIEEIPHPLGRHPTDERRKGRQRQGSEKISTQVSLHVECMSALS